MHVSLHEGVNLLLRRRHTLAVGLAAHGLRVQRRDEPGVVLEEVGGRFTLGDLRQQAGQVVDDLPSLCGEVALRVGVTRCQHGIGDGTHLAERFRAPALLLLHAGDGAVELLAGQLHVRRGAGLVVLRHGHGLSDRCWCGLAGLLGQALGDSIEPAVSHHREARLRQTVFDSQPDELLRKLADDGCRLGVDIDGKRPASTLEHLLQPLGGPTTVGVVGQLGADELLQFVQHDRRAIFDLLGLRVDGVVATLALTHGGPPSE